MVTEDFGGIIVDSVHDVFETLIYILPEESPPRDTDETRIEGELISTIYISGDVNGIVTMACPWNIGEVLTRNMLGTDEKSLSRAEVADCAGEIVNMVAGNIKTRCIEAGVHFTLSIPTVSSGRELVLSCNDDLRGIRIPFLVEGEEVVFQVMVKDSSPTLA